MMEIGEKGWKTLSREDMVCPYICSRFSLLVYIAVYPAGSHLGHADSVEDKYWRNKTNLHAFFTNIFGNIS